MTTIPKIKIEVDADTVEAAREKVKAQMPSGMIVLRETVISDAQPHTITAHGDSPQYALEKGAKEVPAAAEVLRTKVLNYPGTEKIIVRAEGTRTVEQVAGAEARARFGPDAVVRSLERVSRMSGFLKWAPTGEFRATVHIPARVEVVYQEKRAKISTIFVAPDICSHCDEKLDFTGTRSPLDFSEFPLAGENLARLRNYGDHAYDIYRAGLEDNHSAFRCQQCGMLLCAEHTLHLACRKCDGREFECAIDFDHERAEAIRKEVAAEFPDLGEVLKEAWLSQEVEKLAVIYRLYPRGFVAGQNVRAGQAILPFDDPRTGIPEIYRIGHRLNQEGGLRLMQAAHGLFSAKVRHILGASRNLEHMWSGIGEWLG